METTNKETKPICTEKDVLIALSKMDINDRQWLDTQRFSDLVQLVNDKEFRDTTFTNLDWHINNLPKFKNAIIKMCVQAINEKVQNNAEKKIDAMIENYKGFSRGERLDFYKRLVKEKTADNYTDETKYMCRNFGNLLQNALESTLKS